MHAYCTMNFFSVSVAFATVNCSSCSPVIGVGSIIGFFFLPQNFCCELVNSLKVSQV